MLGSINCSKSSIGLFKSEFNRYYHGIDESNSGKFPRE